MGTSDGLLPKAWTKAAFGSDRAQGLAHVTGGTIDSNASAKALREPLNYFVQAGCWVDEL